MPPAGRLTERQITPPADQVDSAIAKLEKAKRPVIIVGHGARDQMEGVISLAETLGAPVITTFKAKGQIGDDHPLACGVLGRSGTPVASWVMNEADLLLVFGASFSNHTGIYPGHPIIQVDYDPLQLGKFHAVEIPVWGEIGVTAKLFAERLEGTKLAATDQRSDVAVRKEIWDAEKANRAVDDRGNGVASAAVFASMSKLVPDDAVIAVDVGNNTYSFGRYFDCSGSQRVLMSGYLGSIGFGYPAAIGAAAARPDQPIVCVTGDGGFGQYMAEVTTAVRHNMNITHVLLNNGQLGKISKEQAAGEWDVWQTQLTNPDFSKYAENCGAVGIRVTEAGAARRRDRQGARSRGPSDGRSARGPEPDLGRSRYSRRSIGGRAYCLPIVTGTALEDSLHTAVDKFIPVVEAIGATVIAVGVLVAATVYLLSELRIRPVAYEHVRLLLGRFLALGLEFQLAADILKTAVSPTWKVIEQPRQSLRSELSSTISLHKRSKRRPRWRRKGCSPCQGTCPSRNRTPDDRRVPVFGADLGRRCGSFRNCRCDHHHRCMPVALPWPPRRFGVRESHHARA